MSVRGVVSLAAVVLTLAGCAKTNRTLAANDASIVPHQDQAAAPVAKADDTHLHPAGDDGAPLPQDPIAKLPPMPVAVLDAIKKLNQPGQGGAVAFLKPLVTAVRYDTDDAGAADVPAVPAVPAAAMPYLLDSGDRIRIFVYGQPSLSRIYPVDAAGAITVPLIGTLKARGQTTYRLGAAIASQLGATVVKDPQVTVEIATSRPFYILGEVRAAGQYPYEPGLTLEAAVAIAGGFGPRASQHEARLTRRLNGAATQLRVPMSEAIRPGDTITIEERWF